MLTINYFASIREALSKDSESITWTAATSNVEQLIDLLVTENGEKWAILQDHSKVLVAVNQTIVARNHQLSDSDEVAFFPPMTGG